MPAANTVSLDITIMGREFRVSCPENEKAGLLQAVGFLDKKMREIRDSGKVIGVERIAIMAALNITHDFLSSESPMFDRDQIRTRVDRLGEMLDQALAQQDNLF